MRRHVDVSAFLKGKYRHGFIRNRQHGGPKNEDISLPSRERSAGLHCHGAVTLPDLSAQSGEADLAKQAQNPFSDLISLALPIANAALEAPILGLQKGTGFDVGDLWIQPLNLGWHTPRADFMSGFGFYAPTGT